jgi:uracil-DNA glycosylase
VVEHLAEVARCRACSNMAGAPVVPRPNLARVYLCGQAPGPREEKLGQPFAWHAGKQLFKWFKRIGVDEETFRARAFIGAVARCFPGKTKTKKVIDRVPDEDEIERCSRWMEREFRMMRPELVIVVGKLAIDQFLEPGQPLVDTVGRAFKVTRWEQTFDVIALPHPSGASTWYLTRPGKPLLAKGLRLLRQHPAWAALAAR